MRLLINTNQINVAYDIYDDFLEDGDTYIVFQHESYARVVARTDFNIVVVEAAPSQAAVILEYPFADHAFNRGEAA